MLNIYIYSASTLVHKPKAMQKVTVTIPKPFSWEGQLIKIKHLKRVWGIVTNAVDGVDEDGSNKTLTIKPVYRPAPKSRLNKKGIFSKHKTKIIKHN